MYAKKRHFYHLFASNGLSHLRSQNRESLKITRLQSGTHLAKDFFIEIEAILDSAIH